MNNNNDDDGYAIGHGRPPRHSRYKPGQSGNPKGRPKGRRNLKTELEEELTEKVVVREGEKRTKVTKRRAVIKGQFAKAMKGDTKAASWVFDLIGRLLDPDDNDRGGTGRQLAADDQAMLDGYIARRTGLQEPDEDPCEPSDDEEEDADE
jgi:hypothetical protein